MKKIFDGYHTLASWINYVLEFLVALGLFALFFLTTFEVASRFFFSQSYTWISESAGYLLAFIVFFGVSCLVHKKMLMKIDFIYKKFPSFIRVLISLVIWSLLIYYAQLLMVYGFEFVQRAEGQMSTSQTFSLPLVRSIIPIAAIFIIIQAVNNILQVLKEVIYKESFQA